MFHSEKRRRPGSRSEPLVRKPAWLASKPLYQILIATVTGLVATGLTAWHDTPFPYRVGEIVDREIRLKIDIKIPNETKTRNERENYARLSPLVFMHNPEPIAELTDRLTSLARAVAKATSLMDLDETVRTEWKDKLTDEAFRILRQIAPDERAVATFNTKLARALKPLLDYGVLDPAALPPDKERQTKDIEVYPVAGESSRLAKQDEVLLSELARPDGPLAIQIRKQWPDSKESTLLFQLVASKLRPTLTYDPDRTRLAEEDYKLQVRDVIDTYPKSYLVVPRGEAITDDQLRLLRAEHDALEASRPWSARLSRLSGLAVIVVALLATMGFYVRTYERRLANSPGQMALLCAICLATLGLARLLAIEPYKAQVLPIAVTSLFMAIGYNRAFALVIAFALSLLTALQSSQPMEPFVVLIGGTSVGIMLLDTVRSRTKLIAVGLFAGLAYGFLSLSLGLLGQQPWTLVVQDALRQFGCGLIAGFLISGSLPFVESFFGIVTDISLIELADTSHPLLQELVRRAPGTYNHSVTVSIIGEAAAAKIGCNALVVRVGALFHDIGKMLKPHYFIENQSHEEKNRHDQLAPAMSTLIIIGHVKDGIDLAQQHHLPEPIIEMIEQHHGTTLVDYFYHEATRELQESTDPDESVEESAFRYPGPKPQTKEAAVLMLADCVESASRALSEPTAARIEKLVHKLAMARLLDGQFNDCGLTLAEVRAIEESLIKSVTSVYHGRIKYPAAV